MDKVNVNITEYCQFKSDEDENDYWPLGVGRSNVFSSYESQNLKNETWPCPKANKGLDFKQCYHM